MLCICIYIHIYIYVCIPTVPFRHRDCQTNKYTTFSHKVDFVWEVTCGERVVVHRVDAANEARGVPPSSARRRASSIPASASADSAPSSACVPEAHSTRVRGERTVHS